MGKQEIDGTDYQLMVQSMLIDFQYMEEGLRMYITVCYERIREHLTDSLPFKLTYKDVQKDSLGTLINKFEQLSNDALLVKELRGLVEHRNSVAHRGYLIVAKSQRTEEHLRQRVVNLAAIKKRTESCVWKVMNAVKALPKGKSAAAEARHKKVPSAPD